MIGAGTRVPVSIFVTRIPVSYPGTWVALDTHVDFLNCEISESSVFTYRLCLYKVEYFHTVCLPLLSLSVTFYRRACLLTTYKSGKLTLSLNKFEINF